MTSALFKPIKLRELNLPNRIMVSPMCQYSATDGNAGDWHLIHLGQLALGGVGLLCIEATAVEAVGRITPGCLGLYSDDNEAALRRLLARPAAPRRHAAGDPAGPCRAQGLEPHALGRRQADRA